MKNKSLFSISIAVFIISLFTQSFSKFQAFDLKASIVRGKEVYTNYCITCHMEEGNGVENVFPPLAKSDYLMADKKRSILQVIKGATGEMKVNGKTYNTPMVGIDLSDEQVSDVLNYVRNSWSNKGAAIKPVDVANAKK
ncbi:MAG: c-type cytochrome [Chitinophagales bacterium]